jgi:Ca-activated chloride channel family protein
MGHAHHRIGLTAVALLLASCSSNRMEAGADAQLEPAIETASDAAAESDGSIVISGQIAVTGSRIRKSESHASAPPPPAVAESRAWVLPWHDQGRDKFTAAVQNAFKVVREEPVSTFSIDVDTASYSWVRASLNRNVLPQPAAVRTEEMINYFPYDYPSPKSAEEPFATNVTVMPSPWSEGRKLVRIGVKGYEIRRASRPRANLVFLVDTSGSMNAPNRLPLVQQ